MTADTVSQDMFAVLHGQPAPVVTRWTYSVADPYVLVFWTWGRGPVLGFDMARDFPIWTAHARRMAARLAVRRAFEREALELPE